MTLFTSLPTRPVDPCATVGSSPRAQGEEKDNELYFGDIAGAVRKSFINGSRMVNGP